MGISSRASFSVCINSLLLAGNNSLSNISPSLAAYILASKSFKAFLASLRFLNLPSTTLDFWTFSPFTEIDFWLSDTTTLGFLLLSFICFLTLSYCSLVSILETSTVSVTSDKDVSWLCVASAISIPFSFSIALDLALVALVLSDILYIDFLPSDSISDVASAKVFKSSVETSSDASTLSSIFWTAFSFSNITSLEATASGA